MSAITVVTTWVGTDFRAAGADLSGPLSLSQALTSIMLAVNAAISDILLSKFDIIMCFIFTFLATMEIVSIVYK
jgi:hypothetical protein